MIIKSLVNLAKKNKQKFERDETEMLTFISRWIDFFIKYKIIVSCLLVPLIVYWLKIRI